MILKLKMYVNIQSCIMMQYADGGDLRDLINKQKREGTVLLEEDISCKLVLTTMAFFFFE